MHKYVVTFLLIKSGEKIFHIRFQLCNRSYAVLTRICIGLLISRQQTLNLLYLNYFHDKLILYELIKYKAVNVL